MEYLGVLNGKLDAVVARNQTAGKQLQRGLQAAMAKLVTSFAGAYVVLMYGCKPNVYELHASQARAVLAATHS